MSITLTLACGDYDRTKPLITGDVSIKGVELVPIVTSSPERHKRMLKFEEFDIAELSLSSYLIAHEQNKDYQAIPVFPHRRFRHGYVFVKTDSKIKTTDDLKGGKIGVRRLQNTAGLWMRGIFDQFYGVKRSEVTWFTEDEEGLEENAQLHMQRIPEGETLEQHLLDDKVDAVIYPEEPKSLHKPGGTSRLFKDYMAEERRYFQATGICPVMHTVVIHKRVSSQYPWLAVELLKAFRQAKKQAMRYLGDQRKSCLIWERNYLETEMELFGGDAWPYSLAGNRKSLEAMIAYSLADGFINKAPVLEDLFVTDTLSFDQE